MASQRHCLELNPGHSLGPFELGQTLFFVLDQILRPNASTFPKVNIAWDQMNAGTSPIAVSLSSSAPPVILTFDGPSQRLIKIEVVDKLDEWVRYKEKKFGGGGDGLKSVDRLLGPTYPPTSHPYLANTDVVSFPGVAFAYERFKEAGDSRLTRLILTHPPPANESRDAYLEPYIHPSPDCAKGDLERVIIRIDNPSILTFKFLADDSVELPNLEVMIGVTSSEDLLCAFGPPVCTFWKEDDRLSIHSPAQSSAMSQGSNPYFYLYPSLGVTFLLSASHVLLKVLLHSNLPGEVHFGRNSRCHWTLQGPGSESIMETDDLKAIQRFFSHQTSSFSATLPIPIPPAAARSLTPSPPSQLLPDPSPTESSPSSVMSTKRGRKDKSRNSPVPQAVVPIILKENDKSRGSENGSLTMVLNRGSDLDESASEVLKSRNTELWAPNQHILLELTGEGLVETLWIV